MADTFIGAVEGNADVAKMMEYITNPPKLQVRDISEAEKSRALEHVTPAQARAMLKGNELIIRSLADVLTSPEDIRNRQDVLEDMNAARDLLQNAANEIRANQ